MADYMKNRVPKA